MNPEFLKTEAERAEEAELESEEQLRRLHGVIDRALNSGAVASASDCARLVGAALALNERLADRAKRARLNLQRANYANRTSEKPKAPTA